MLGNKNFGFLVESVNLLHHLISRYRNLSSSFARQIAKTSQQTQPNLSIIRTIIGFQIPPQFFLLLKTLIRLRLNQEKGISAAERLDTIGRDELAGMLYENSDEPYCEEIAKAITDEIRRGNRVDTTTKLREIIEKTLSFIRYCSLHSKNM